MTPIRTQARDAVRRRVGRALVGRARCPRPSPTPTCPAVEVERPAEPEHGDFASNLAMKLARPYRMRAARDRRARSRRSCRGRRAGRRPARPSRRSRSPRPGFLNLRLARRGRSRRSSRRSSREPAAWGRVSADRRASGRTSSSCRPTRPARCTSATRAARSSATCSAACSRRRASEVTREYYFNDFGRARSATSARRSRRSGAASRSPRTATTARYVARPRARSCRTTSGRRRPRRGADADGWSSGAGRPERIRAGIEASLARPRRPLRRLDERGSLHDEGWVERAVERLRERGHVYEQDGAIWFRSTAFGDDKDRVIYPVQRRADLLRGRHRLRDREVQPRLRPPHLHLGRRPPRHGRARPQRGGGDGLRPGRGRDAALLAGCASCATAQEVSMSKRAGEFITLDELLAEVGVDAARWFFASRAPTTGIDFDIELAKKQSSENPVYYVQYAHARIASILRKAAEAGLERRPSDVAGTLGGAPEAALARARRALPGGRRGRRRGRGDAGRHGVRDRARDDVPRLLPRRAGRRSGPSRRGPAARLALVERAADHARERARAAGDLGAGVDVGPAAPRRPASGLAGQAQGAGDRAERRRVVGDDDPAHVAARTGAGRCARPAGLADGGARGGLELRRVRRGVPCGLAARAPRPRPALRGRRGDRRPSRPRRPRPPRPPRRPRGARCRSGTRRTCPRAARVQPVAEIGGQVVRAASPRPAPRRPCTSPGGGSARSIPACVRRSRRRPASRPRPGPPGRYEGTRRVREEQGLAQDGRHAVEDRLLLRVEAPPCMTLASSSGVRLPAPSASSARRVALVHGLASEASRCGRTFFGSRPRRARPAGPEDRRCWSWSAWVVLVGEGDLVLARSSEPVRETTYIFFSSSPVEAGHPGAEHVELQSREFGVRGHQAERLVQPLAGGHVGRRVLLVELLA